MSRALKIARWAGEFALVMLVGFELLYALPVLLGGGS
jgi:hypothetical protein